VLLCVLAIPALASTAAGLALGAQAPPGHVSVRIPARAAVGRSLVVALRHSRNAASESIRLCVRPPGGRTGCKGVALAGGVAGRRAAIAVPRPGGWTITVRRPVGRAISRIVWVQHPGGGIRLLADGDSEMQILDGMIAQDLDGQRVDVTSDARISTGLTNGSFFNWQAEARRQAAGVAPDVSVVFMGANDGFSTRVPGGAPVSCCDAQWSLGYADLVAEMMRSLLRGNAGRVYWFLLPTPRPANFQSLFDGVNRGIREAAARFPGRVVLIDANAFFTPGNRYRDYMSIDGHGFTIHETDGIHLSAAADVYAAQLVVAQLHADQIIR
jgi:lysophospholipase L1-like esterase